MSKGGSGGFTHEPNIRKDEKGRHDPRCPDTWSGFGEPVTVIMLMCSLPVRGIDLWPVGENLNDSAHRGCMAGEGADEGIFTRLIGNAEENRFRNARFKEPPCVQSRNPRWGHIAFRVPLIQVAWPLLPPHRLRRYGPVS